MRRLLASLNPFPRGAPRAAASPNALHLVPRGHPWLPGDIIACRAFGTWPDWPPGRDNPTEVTARAGMATLHLDGSFWPRMQGHVALVADRATFLDDDWGRQGYSLALFIDLEPSVTVAAWLDSGVSPFAPVVLAGPWPDFLERAVRSRLIRALPAVASSAAARGR